MIHKDINTYIEFRNFNEKCCVTFEYIEEDNEEGGMGDEINITSINLNNDNEIMNLLEYIDPDELPDINGLKSRCKEYVNKLNKPDYGE